MKKILIGAVVVIIALFLSGCAMIPTKAELLFYDASSASTPATMMASGDLHNSSIPPVFVVGGWNKRDIPLVEFFAKGIPGAILVFPRRRIPISTAGNSLYLQILEIMKKEGIKGPIFLVLGSWAGLSGRIVAAQHPELVMGIITIGTPVGGYPERVNNFIFGTGDEDCNVPLYIIAGFDESSPAKFWMTGTLNDGLLGLENVTDLGRRKITAQKIFPGVRHLGLFMDPRIISQVNLWIQEEVIQREARAATKALLAVGK